MRSLPRQLGPNAPGPTFFAARQPVSHGIIQVASARPYPLTPAKPVVVAGLDTAANRYHLYCDNGFQSHHFIPTKAKMDPDDRRQALYLSALQAFESLPAGTLVVAEEPLALTNGKTTRLLSLAAGAIWAAHLDCDILWTWADVSQWKKRVIGNGNADKDQIREWVVLNMGLAWPEGEVYADYYDAAALCRYGQLQLKAQT